MAQRVVSGTIHFIQLCWPLQVRGRTLRLISTQPYEGEPVRVRFAPSPTGFLHFGGLRTAMYNYFLSRNSGGIFVLRIEDTDQTRLVPGAVENVEDALDWIGLSPDESPRHGGSFGPYVQSQRLHYYKEHVNKLLEMGAAYRCFCSSMRLELLRKNAIKSGAVPRYDNKCRSLQPDEAQTRHEAGEASVIRLRHDGVVCNFQDEVFGPISCIVEHEGDFVLIKSDGYPTYHFANVVDDHMMKISHVLRGIEWQISTPKHLSLYNAFGWTPPKFAHLPLLLNADGSKLSKRKGAMDVLDYRRQGFVPEAIIGFLAQAGGGFSNQVTQTMTLSKKEDLIRLFDIGRINRNSCRLDFAKLPEFNKQALVIRLQDPVLRKVFLADVKKLVADKFQCVPTDSQVMKVVDWISQQRLTTINDLVSADTEFIWKRPEFKEKLPDEEQIILRQSAEYFENLPVTELTRDLIGKSSREFFSKQKIDFKQAMKVLRLVLSGLDSGPSVGEIVEVLGKDECLVRVKQFSDTFNK